LVLPSHGESGEKPLEVPPRRQRDKHDSLDEPFSEEDPRVVELPDPGPDPRQQAQTGS
jgi:hypothetical protein